MRVPPLLVALACAAPLGAQAQVEQVKLASTKLAPLNVTPETADFYARHLAQQLDQAGVRVITPQDVAAVVGLERQNQLLGCAQGGESCMIELAQAVGVDGLITGDRPGPGCHAGARVQLRGSPILETAHPQGGS